MGILNKWKKSIQPAATSEEEVKVVKKESAPVEKGSKKNASLVGSSDGIVMRPLVTEKSAILASQNMYVFAVNKVANRMEVASAIHRMYGIKPVSVNVLNVRGKYVTRGKIFGRRSNWKKAIVTLPKGKSINLYEGV